jgi:dTDP-4-amino-4,6-dideoxygalactose transaminase
MPRLAVGESPLASFDSHSIKKRGRVAALLPVHQYGMPCDMRRILEIGKRYQIPVVEDAACALGSELSIDGGSSWEQIGKPHGQIACFSFHPRKIITTGDGGMLTTAKSEYDEQFRLLRHHGMNVPDYKRHDLNAGTLEHYLLTGFNFRMTDIQAAIGSEQLNKLSQIIESRRKCGKLYKKLLGEISWLETQNEKKYSRTNWQTFVCTLLDNAPCDRFDLMKTLGEMGVASRRSNVNAHEEPPYQPQNWNLPISERVVDRGIALPMFAGLTEDNVHRCVQVIKEKYGC